MEPFGSVVLRMRQRSGLTNADEPVIDVDLVGADGTIGVVVALNLCTTIDPNLLATAESLLCDDD